MLLANVRWPLLLDRATQPHVAFSALVHLAADPRSPFVWVVRRVRCLRALALLHHLHKGYGTVRKMRPAL